MARPSVITFDSVRRSCLKMMGRGEWPTNQSIYEDLGRKGSMGTIQKHRTAFFESLKDKGLEALPAALPKDLVPVIEEWWSISVRHAGEAHAGERQHLLESIADHESAIDKLNADIVHLGEQLSERNRVISGLNRDCESLKSELDAKETLHGELQKRLDGLLGQMQELRDVHARELRDIERVNDSKILNYEDRVGTLKQELTASLEREAMEVARSERNADHFLLQINTERERYQSMEASFAAITERLESELTIARARENRFIRSQQEMEQRMNALVESLDEAGERERVYAREKQQSVERIAILEADLASSINREEAIDSSFKVCKGQLKKCEAKLRSEVGQVGDGDGGDNE